MTKNNEPKALQEIHEISEKTYEETNYPSLREKTDLTTSGVKEIAEKYGLNTPEQRVYTFGDYLTWPEDERWEIIDGVPYLQATPTSAHQEALTELIRQFANYLTGKTCRVYPAPFCVRLPQGAEKDNSEVKTVLEPDISIICDRSKIDQKGCKGAPDLVIEIISPSSGKKDRVMKFNKYETAGVQENWIVEPDAKLVSVFLLQNNRRFGRPEMYTEEDKVRVSLFPDLEIDLHPVFDFTLTQAE